MKLKTTRKEINERFAHVYRCGYCDLQNIFSKDDACFCNCGVYGWNFDVYCDWGKDVAITTGYRNMTGTRIPHEIIEKYSAIGKEIRSNCWSRPYEDTRAAMEENQRNFIAELLATC
jgi:hypothetical protein